MTYQSNWTNGNSQGRVQAGVSRVRACDAADIAAAINRRLALTYQLQQDYSSVIAAGLPVRRTLLHGAFPPPFEDFRNNTGNIILSPPVQTTPGSPPTPTAMQWLWPQGDGNENAVIVGTNPAAGQVSLFDKLNGTVDWTDPGLVAGRTAIRAVHWNELRQSLEWLSRGRWTLPLYFSGGLFSMLPDTPWFGGSIANNGSFELRTVGFALMYSPGPPPMGLASVTVRSSSYLEITADQTCTAQVSQCLRPIDFINDLPSWNKYQTNAGLAWGAPGGAGSGDSTPVGSMSLSQGTPTRLSGAAVASALQDMVDGAQQNWLVRRTDTGPQTVNISGQLVVEFDLNTPPN
jgi:hypothetical protein